MTCQLREDRGHISNATCSDDHVSNPQQYSLLLSLPTLLRWPLITAHSLTNSAIAHFLSTQSSLLSPARSQCTFSYLFSLPLLTTPLPSPYHHHPCAYPWPTIIIHSDTLLLIPHITTYSPRSSFLYTLPIITTTHSSHIFGLSAQSSTFFPIMISHSSL